MHQRVIINIGSINIDEVFQVEHIVKEGETLSSTHFSRSNGGKGANQSVAIARAGASVFHLGKVGPDGHAIVQTMKDSAVRVDHINVADNEITGRAIIQVNAAGNNSIILHPGANHLLDRTEIMSSVKQALAESTERGILLLQNEVNDVPWLIAHGRELKLEICLNLAPWSPAAAHYPFHLIDILNVNETEANELVRGLQAARGEHQAQGSETQRLEVREQAQRNLDYLLKCFPQLAVIITLGEHGVLASYVDSTTGQRTCPLLPIHKVKVVDTTGAGDTFVGYFLAQYSEGTPFSQCLRVASRAAALSVTKKGAMASIPLIVEVKKEMET